MDRFTYTFECTKAQAELIRRTLALQEELDQLALTAPDGTVFDACEEAVLHQGRDLQRQVLQNAVARRIEAMEKKGSRCGCASAAERRKIEGRNNGTC